MDSLEMLTMSHYVYYYYLFLLVGCRFKKKTLDIGQLADTLQSERKHNVSLHN